MITNCPVCATEIPPSEYDHPNGARIQCPVCGTYRLMEQAHRRLIESRTVRSNVLYPNRRLSGALRQRAEHGEEPVLSDPEALEREYRPAVDLLEMIDRIVKHIASKAPAGNKFIPLVGHRDYTLAGAEDPEAFDHALGQAQEQTYVQRKAPDEAAYRLTTAGWRHLRTLPVGPNTVNRVFLSHAASDQQLALFVRDELLKNREGMSVFVASRPGDIRADQDWLPVIQRELQSADAYCVLLTPNSTGRPWVWFETGAAWMSGKKWVIARAAGLPPEEVPLPLSIRQTYSLDDSAGAREVFRALDVDLQDSASFAESLERLAVDATQETLRQDGWKGINLDGTFYAWDGPLQGMRDLDPEPEPPRLLDALRANGLTPTWADRDRLAKRLAEGKRQVFVTDCRTYRRKISQGSLVLIVAA